MVSSFRTAPYFGNPSACRKDPLNASQTFSFKCDRIPVVKDSFIDIRNKKPPLGRYKQTKVSA
jgi:hypothetical protein